MPNEVDVYLSKIPEPARTTLQQLRATIRTLAPGATEAVRYGIATFQQNGGLVGFGASKNHCALYMMSGDSLEPFLADLTKYETSKGTIRFPVDAPLPKALVKKLVKARLAENDARAGSKKKPAAKRKAAAKRASPATR